MASRSAEYRTAEYRTTIVPVTLTGASYRLAHDSCHRAALLWNQAVNWVHGEWKAKRSPNKYDIQGFLNSIPRQDRPLHAHTTETIAHDLSEALTTARTNSKKGMKVRSPWRKKNYRPLSFSKNSGWRISKGQLHLSLGRGRPRIDLSIPTVLDSATGEEVDPGLWGEIQLCWDRDKRHFSLHIPYETLREVSVGDAFSAIDEGIINSMGLATWVDDKTIDVTIINGREARAIKRQRNKAVGQLQHKISRCKIGSKKHKRLVAAKKKINSKAKLSLRDFDHQVSNKAANHVIGHNTARLIVGDVRGIEKETKSKRRMGRHGRQQPVVEGSTGTLPQRQDRIRPRFPERIRLNQDLSSVLDTQSTIRSILPMQEPYLWFQLPSRRCRSDQYPPEGVMRGIHSNWTGHKSPSHVSPGCRALVT